MTQAPAALTCKDCDQPINPNLNGTWKQVTGWVETRSGGGAHAVSMPSAPHAWMCKTCMMIRKSGHYGMTSLFD